MSLQTLAASPLTATATNSSSSAPSPSSAWMKAAGAGDVELAREVAAAGHQQYQPNHPTGEPYLLSLVGEPTRGLLGEHSTPGMAGALVSSLDMLTERDVLFGGGCDPVVTQGENNLTPE